MSDTAFVETEAPPPNHVVIPYTPRSHFLPLHESKARFKFVVAHRRAGKSVAEINEMIRRALINTRQQPPPRYAYIGPSFAQTKDLIWGYLKHYTAPIPGVTFSESDLQCTLPNGAMINLYGGASAYERMRGLYFDGVVMDEFPMLNPAVFSTVVRPCLADYRGWACISGTSNGDDHFHALMKSNRNDPQWDFFVIPVTDTDALHPDEVKEMTKDMSPEEYAREMLCSFDAPIEGSYYADLMNQANEDGRICSVPHDPEAPVHTWWDIGISDFTCIWFIQVVGKEIHVIDYAEHTGLGLPQMMPLLNGVEQSVKRRAKYNYHTHFMPHDIKARELGTGKSRYETMLSLLPDSQTVFPGVVAKIEDGINAVRSILPMCYFDKVYTESGVAAIRNYHRSKMGRPVHNWASHGADAFRTGAVNVHHILHSGLGSNVISMNGRIRRKIRGII